MNTRNIGSIVTIRHDLEAKEYMYGVYATPWMVAQAGKKFRITRTYNILGDDNSVLFCLDCGHFYSWTEDMFEPMKIRKEMSIDDRDRIIDNSDIFLSMIGDNV